MPFTKNATGTAKGSRAWKKMYHKFQMEEDEFRQHYHKLKVLCHNVVVVIHEMKESDIDPGFLSETLDSASKLV